MVTRSSNSRSCVGLLSVQSPVYAVSSVLSAHMWSIDGASKDAQSPSFIPSLPFPAGHYHGGQAAEMGVGMKSQVNSCQVLFVCLV